MGATTKLKPCPFCGKSTVWAFCYPGDPGNSSDSDSWSVSCANCNTLGPQANTQQQAEEMWNGAARSPITRRHDVIRAPFRAFRELLTAVLDSGGSLISGPIAFGHQLVAVVRLGADFDPPLPMPFPGDFDDPDAPAEYARDYGQD